MSRSRYLIDPYVQAIFVEFERIKASGSDPVKLAAVERAETIVSERAEAIRAAYARSSDLTKKAWEILRDAPEQIGSFTVGDLIVRLRDREATITALETENENLLTQTYRLENSIGTMKRNREEFKKIIAHHEGTIIMLRERLGRKDGEQ